MTHCRLQTIQDKRECAIAPITCSEVAGGGIIHTVEHRANFNLSELDYTIISLVFMIEILL